MIVEILVVFLMGAMVVLIAQSRKRPQNFPPGPLALPLLGSLPFLGREAHKTLLKWKQTYGSIIGIWFGSYRAIVVNDVNLIREALNHPSFAGRPKLNFFLERTEGAQKGIATNEGPHCMEQRKFLTKGLRDYAGPKAVETNVQEEIEILLKRFKASAGKPVPARDAFTAAAVNLPWKVLFGDRLDETDPEAVKMLHHINKSFEKNGYTSNLAIFLPWLVKIAPKLSGYESMAEDPIALQRLIKKKIKLHRHGYMEGQPRDLADVYEDEIRKTVDLKSSFHEKQGNMSITIHDLFLGYGETTSTTLSWMVALLTHNPEVQARLQAEIDDFIGTARHPSLTDRPHMPYAEAFVHELLRFTTISPFGIFHNATEDVEFQGFIIPKDTMIIPNYYGVHYDEAIWGDPQNFRPERFLDECGKFYANNNLVAFSTGKRSCLGETIEKDVLFLFATTIFQALTVRSAGGLPSLEPNVGFTLSPQKFEIVWEERRTSTEPFFPKLGRKT